MKFVPDTVLCDVLSKWCRLVDLTKFDTASSSAAQRAFLLRLYSRSCFSVAINLEQKQERVPNLIWCKLKCMKISEVVVSYHTEFHRISELLSSIKFITYSSWHTDTDKRSMIKYVNKCSQLNGISICGLINPDDLVNINVNIWAQLLTFESKTWCNTHRITALLTLHCTQLTVLLIEHCGDENEVSILKVLKNNRNLAEITIHALHVCFSKDIISALEQLNHLTIVSLTNCREIPIRSMVDYILKGLSTLKRLCLKCSYMNGFNFFSGFDEGCCKVITSVYIKSSQKSHNGLNNAADMMYIFQHLTTLDHITFFDVGHLLSYEVFGLIARTNTQMSHLVVRGCGQKCKIDTLKDIFEDCEQDFKISCDFYAYH